jgi:transposase
MRQIKEVLRLRHEAGLSQRRIALAVGLGKSSVCDYLERAKHAGLCWEQIRALSEQELEQQLFQQVGRNEPSSRAPIDLSWVQRELRKKGVTLQLLWSEYAEAASAHGSSVRPYQYSQFCEAYARHKQTLHPVMRQEHRAGEKMFVDFSGVRPCIVDPLTGEVTEVELYVAVLGASNYTYAEATRTQQLPDFVGATTRALEYFGAVVEVIMPDQLRSAVKRPCLYEPEINATFAEMGAHYGCAIVPARPRKPRDKAKVEVGVQIAQRWILACLRNRAFFSLDDLNAAVAELLERLNTRPLSKSTQSRRELFETLDRPAMKPLPASRYVLGQWKLDVGVPPDYTVIFDDRRYSVPCALIGQRVDIRATTSTVEVLHKHERVASHVRSYGPKGKPVIAPEHRPRSHQEYGAWPPERFVSWAQTIGPHVAALIEAMLAESRHPELRYRSALGVIRLAKSYGNERADAACRRAIAIRSPSYRSVQTILKHALDREPLPADVDAPQPAPAHNTPPHEHVRGAEYFDKEEMQ